MKYPLSWLNEYVSLNLPAQELADRLSLAGFEVESIDTIGRDLSHIITAQIETISPHPNADKLSVTTVNDGKHTHQIVCGANNISEGAIVPVSLPGATLPNGMTIKKATLRGVESNGMICSEAELGCTDVSDGIWHLPEDTPIGIDMIEFATLKDTVFDIGILPNRGDAQSIIGLAREISILLNTPLKAFVPQLSETSDTPAPTVSVSDNTKCPLYTARLIESIQCNKTPIWMARRLQLCGIRSIHPIVDITNYVMLEIGQPLHAFDADSVNGTLSVRHAKKNESITTLDNTTRTLSESDILITDDSGPIALAGVMGGKGSDVSHTTKRIILEAAVFDAISTRKSASTHNARTDSAIRFEKHVDPSQVILASNRAAELIQSIGNATVSTHITCIQNDKHRIFQLSRIPFSAQAINNFLGSAIPEKDMIDILAKLNISISDGYAHIPPARQHDLEDMPCLAEEIARLYGYDAIPSTLPMHGQPSTPNTLSHTIKKDIENYLLSHGFYNVCTFPMVNSESISASQIAQPSMPIELENPLNPDEAIMRPHMLPSLLNVLAFNLKRQESNIAIYEAGHTYSMVDDVPKQSFHIAGLCTGSPYRHAYKDEDKSASLADAVALKGHIENILTLSQRTSIHIQTSDSPPTYFHPIQHGQLITNEGDSIGHFGILHPSTCEAYGITQSCGFFTLNLDKLSQLERMNKRFKPLSKFPSTRRDIAIVCPKHRQWQHIIAPINNLSIPWLHDIFLFDMFHSEKIGPNNQSLAIACIYQSDEGTLTDADVDHVHEKIIDILRADPDIQFRD